MRWLVIIMSPLRWISLFTSFLWSAAARWRRRRPARPSRPGCRARTSGAGNQLLSLSAPGDLAPVERQRPVHVVFEILVLGAQRVALQRVGIEHVHVVI